jgi:prepilin-type N-terminal cleavage/methylation domain-containing protein
MSLNGLRRGLTLVEVIAALGLLSSLMVGVLTALSSHKRMLSINELRLEAVDAADELLNKWTQLAGGIPAPARGKLPNHDLLEWDTKIVDKAYEPMWGIRVVRLEIREATVSKKLLLSLSLFASAPSASSSTINSARHSSYQTWTVADLH